MEKSRNFFFVEKEIIKNYGFLFQVFIIKKFSKGKKLLLFVFNEESIFSVDIEVFVMGN
jgi:hypothetical protein